jgi:uncharacterized Zn-binding protein involved in type VI secretion
MPGVQRQGDTNAAGGVAKSGVASVRINGRPIVVNGISVTPHPCCGRKGCPPIHCNAQTKGGLGTVRAGGVPVITDGAVDTCGHSRKGGSGDVRAG